MPQKLLYEVDQLDLTKPAFSIEEIRKYNLQRYEFEQLTSILFVRPEEHLVVGLRDLGEDEFWARGHIPGRPIFPGVLMVEAAAQLCSFYIGKHVSNDGFFGFGGIDEVRFRGVVKPGDRMVLVARGITVGLNRSQFATQGVVDGKLVFEAKILGLRIR